MERITEIVEFIRKRPDATETQIRRELDEPERTQAVEESVRQAAEDGIL